MKKVPTDLELLLRVLDAPQRAVALPQRVVEALVRLVPLQGHLDVRDGLLGVALLVVDDAEEVQCVLRGS